MYTTKHTPGPWKISMMNDGPIGITSSIGEWIAKVYPWSKAQGNARLIAAAPDLLEALIESSKELQRLRDVHLPRYEEKIGEPNKEILMKSLVVIAKAKGEL